MKTTFAATQFACSADAAANLDSAERAVRSAAGQGAQVVLLQELFETPYFCKDHLASHFQLARPIAGSPGRGAIPGAGTRTRSRAATQRVRARQQRLFQFDWR